MFSRAAFSSAGRAASRPTQVAHSDLSLSPPDGSHPLDFEDHGEAVGPLFGKPVRVGRPATRLAASARIRPCTFGTGRFPSRVAWCSTLDLPVQRCAWCGPHLRGHRSRGSRQIGVACNARSKICDRLDAAEFSGLVSNTRPISP